MHYSKFSSERPSGAKSLREPANIRFFQFSGWVKTNLLVIFVVISSSLNIAMGIALLLHWFSPVMMRTPEERMQAYSQYLPENAREEYRDNINVKISAIMELHRKIRIERQLVADLLTQPSVDKQELYARFKTIRALNQQINTIYQETLVNVEADLPLEERQKSHNLIMTMLKHEKAGVQ